MYKKIYNLYFIQSKKRTYSQPLFINDDASNCPREPPQCTLRSLNSASSITDDNHEYDPPGRNLTQGTPPTLDFYPIEAPHNHHDPRQENCSTLACHIFSHICCMHFNSTSEVCEWCQSYISVDILWKLNPILLMSTAGTKLCRLCVAKQMTISHNCVHSDRRKKIINLKIKMRGACTCKTRFLRFLRSD